MMSWTRLIVIGPDTPDAVSVPDHEPVIDGGAVRGRGEMGSSLVQDDIDNAMNNSANKRQ
jgi:hypothetical protein